MPAYTFEGATLTRSPITYSFVDFGNTNGSVTPGGTSGPYNFTSNIQPGVPRTNISNAINRWATVSGLTFKLVTDVKGGAPADIRIGYGLLVPTISNSYASTVFRDGSGPAGGSDIRLEYPVESKAAPVGKDLAYTASGQTDTQLMLREIGHAIGLGSSSDLNRPGFPRGHLDCVTRPRLAPRFARSSALLPRQEVCFRSARAGGGC